jgi:hypothetical protein
MTEAEAVAEALSYLNTTLSVQEMEMLHSSFSILILSAGPLSFLMPPSTHDISKAHNNNNNNACKTIFLD